jgi:hypothetical protein
MRGASMEEVKDNKNNEIDNLGQEELLQVLANDIGLKFDVPDILTFLDDDYYLGSIFYDKTYKRSRIFPMWREFLQDLYPNNLTTKSSYVTVSGCIGSGKSTFSSIIMMYDFLKLQAMEDAGRFFELINQNGIWLYGCSIYEYKADQFIKPIIANLKNCPFLQDLKKQGLYNNNIIISPAYGIKSIVSSDAATIWLSEVNEYRNPQDVITSALSRMQGRFQKGFGLYNHFILDCSDTTVDSAVETFIHDSPYSNEVVSYRADIWSVKPHLYWHMEPKSFKVYGGDSMVFPHIIKADEDTSNYDQSRIIDVPMELYNEFSHDVNKALKEKAGLALIAGGLLFPNESINRYFTLPQKIKDVEIVDSYDITRIWDLDNVEEAINTLPEQRYIYVGIDAGYATDHYGIALGYVDHVKYREKVENEEATRDFKIKIPIVFGLGRKQGQETSIPKVRDFLYKVNSIRPIKLLGYDNFQSIELTQEMKLIGIDCKYFSVEKDKYYLMFKNALYAGLIDLPDNKLLYREFRCLKHIGDHVDHSNVESFSDGKQGEGVNSKDLSDAVVRCFAAIRENLETAIDVPTDNNNYHTAYWESLITDLVQRKQTQQNILQGNYNQNKNFNKFSFLKDLK